MLKKKYKETLSKLTKLQGGPRYIAMGVAIGVFIGITPTIPFHTILAIIMAFILRGSKPAAIISVWISNPATIPFFYYASYKTGHLFLLETSEKPQLNLLLNALKSSTPLVEKWNIIETFFHHHFETACTILAGGVILAIIPAILSYFVTLRSLNTYSNMKLKN
jgi:hypothetical protein